VRLGLAELGNREAIFTGNSFLKIDAPYIFLTMAVNYLSVAVLGVCVSFQFELMVCFAALTKLVNFDFVNYVFRVIMTCTCLLGSKFLLTIFQHEVIQNLIS
jgi:hypothetical protein